MDRPNQYYYYYEEDGFKRGPFSLSELTELSNRLVISPRTAIETDSGQRCRAGRIKGLFANLSKERSSSQLRRGSFDDDIGNILNRPVFNLCKRCQAILKTGQTRCPECGFDNEPEEEIDEPHDPADAIYIHNAYRAYLICYIIALLLTTVGTGCLTVCAGKSFYATSISSSSDIPIGIQKIIQANEEDICDTSLVHIVLIVFRHFSPVSFFICCPLGS